MNDLIDIPPLVDAPRTDVYVAGPTSSFVGSVVRFDDPSPPQCWAHHSKRYDSCAEDCWSHSCIANGTGRLGLCPDHEREILG